MVPLPSSLRSRVRRTVLFLVLCCIVIALAKELQQPHVRIQASLEKQEAVDIVSDSGDEMLFYCLKLGSSEAGRANPNNTLYFAPRSSKAEARIHGEWVEAECFLPGGQVAPRISSEGTLLLPMGADAVRVRLKYVRASMKWRVLGLLSSWGVRLPPKIVIESGPPQGRLPRWKEMMLEVPIKEHHIETRLQP